MVAIGITLAFATSVGDREKVVSYLQANSRQNRKSSKKSIQLNDEQL